MKLIKYISGMLLLTLAINLIVISQIGASPWDAVNAGLANITKFSFGTWTTLSGVVLVFLISIITKSKPVYMSVVIGLLTGVLIDFWSMILSDLNLVPGYPLGLLGIVLFALGISMYTKTDYPVNPIDNFMVGLIEKFHLNYGQAKLITDVIGLIIAIIIGGPVGIGTILIYILVPLLLQIFDKIT